MMKKFLLTLLFFSNLAFGQTQVMNGVDDGTYHVSLGHTFPYYGGLFTDAWMSSNGFIMLYDPVSQFGNPNTSWSHCCNGRDLTTTTSGYYSFMIAPLWTDLRHDTNVEGSGYFYETASTGTQFLWNKVKEYGTNNLNTFGVELWPDGSFDFHYQDVTIANHTTTIGFTGDLSFGDYNQVFHKTLYEGGMNIDHILTFTDQETYDSNGNLTDAVWWGQDGGYDPSVDCTDALNDTRCPGYEEAYFNQQCDIDALYSVQCTGYDQAILLQEMSNTDFIFGDDITDFYYEEEDLTTYVEETFYEEEEYYGGEEEGEFGYLGSDGPESYGTDDGMDGGSEEEIGTLPIEELAEVSTASLLPEEGEEVYSEPFDEPEEITVGADPISEDIIVEEVFEEEVILEEVEGPSINPIAIAMAQVEAGIAETKENMSKLATDSTPGEDTNNEENLRTFEAETTFFEESTISLIVDPTVTVIVDQTEEESETVEVMNDNTVASSEQGFQEQQNQSFSTGQSITAVLNNVAPNFSQFDVAPPSAQEQQTTDRASSQANNMSEEQLASNLDEFADEMQDSGGFTDQSLTIFLMGRVNGFDNYGGQLQDTAFYNDRGLPVSSVQNDRNIMLQLIGTSGKHEQMIAEQY